MAHIEITTTPSTEPLTQEQVWDDTTLINTWDAALDEYRKYHSIEARSEDVEAILKRVEAEEEGVRQAAKRTRDAAREDAQMEVDQKPETPTTETVDEKAEEQPTTTAQTLKSEREDTHEEEDEQDRVYKKLKMSMEKAKEVERKVEMDPLLPPVQLQETPETSLETSQPPTEENQQGEEVQAPQGQTGMPAMPVIGGSDEGMRNLMMSWYWAGYYTGLQEGRCGR